MREKKEKTQAEKNFVELRERIKRWFRHKHFTTHPAMDNHAHFMGCLSYLSGISGVEIPCDKGEKESWKDFLEAFRKLTFKQLESLDVYINRH